MSDPRAVVGVASAEHRSRLTAVLTNLGYEVTLTKDCEDLLAQARARAPRLAVVDHAFLACAGEVWWGHLRESLPQMSVAVLPQGSGAELTGAFWNNAPGIDATESAEAGGVLAPLLGVAIAPPRAPRHIMRKSVTLDPFVGGSAAIRRLAEEAHRALESESPVLIEGETGTGKGVLAAWLHHRGPRACSAFVDLNCAGFSRELMDAELFGHEKGAFTGAVSAKPGLLEVADGGTLFLDEIGDMDIAIQAKLLKVIEEHRYRRVGDTRERQADVRILVATHHHLLDRVHEGRFREDLYYRVSVLPLRMPALRERVDDIVPLARGIIASLTRESRGDAPAITAEAEQALLRNPWPGNLRELRNALERALLAGRGGPIEPSHLGLDREPPPDPGSVPPVIEGRTFAEIERAYIERVLNEEQMHVERTAQRLGIPRSTLYQKLRALGIRTLRSRSNPPEERGSE